MALTQLHQVLDAGAQRQPSPPISRHNVIPFPAPRVQLPVTLLAESEDESRTQLKAFLHSPLGVYVFNTEIVRNQVRLQLDIAPDDLDFTLHTLIASQPHAMIGPLKRRSFTRESR